ncbi:MAG: class I SAM-dependent methyltransferase [Thermodesulfobacteriota bacterium]
MIFPPFFKAIVAQIPGARKLRNWHVKRRTWREFPGSGEYWERRYSDGGNSGSGSYGALGEFKASVLKRFVKQHDVASVIEFGCGDGNQLRQAEYTSYIGLDVARKAIQLCRQQFSDDATKSFFLYDPECFIDNAQLFRADATISLDVIYHLVEDHVFEQYMAHLFQCAKRFVIIYSSDWDIITNSPHEKHRHFSHYVESHFSEWQFLDKVENPFPLSKYPPPLGSLADFFIYEKIAAK